MRILSIETSCDETAVAIVDVNEEAGTTKISVLANSLISQAKIHESYGGVFPNLAKREHQKNLIPVLGEALNEAGLLKKTSKKIPVDHMALEVLSREPELKNSFEKFIPSVERPQIDLIAVTEGPGLEPTLWVGINFARALSATWDIPVVPCNHMEGHILVATLRGDSTGKKSDYIMCKAQYPALALLISGGHTELVLMDNVDKYKIVGETKDDAVGECFDKIARTLNLPYPGGPEISRLAEIARKENLKLDETLPRPMLKSSGLDFSFSGLKTAVLYLVQKLGKLDKGLQMKIAREAEDAITEVLITKTKNAVEQYEARTIIIGGGVVANENLRKEFSKLALSLGVSLLIPQIDHSTDNALMITLAGYSNKENSQGAELQIKASGNLKIA